ncbi:MAG: lipopolysaccharide heptosyltransferase I [Candidatus Competibacterales bacterium]
MKLLVVKLSSLGDVIHLLPALTAAKRQCPALGLDWVVEAAYAPLLEAHPLVDRVITVELRRWRRRPWRHGGAWRRFRSQLRRWRYDLVLDAQGLIKSAFIAAQARGPRVGLNWASAWEGPAAWSYQRKLAVDPRRHAIDRMGALLGQALDLSVSLDGHHLDYGFGDAARGGVAGNSRPYLVFCHGTSWPAKAWPELRWRQLAAKAGALGFHVKLSWGNAAERRRAEAIAAGLECAEVLPHLPLDHWLPLLGNARGVVAVDTGLAHLAAALGTPTLTLYGPTDPRETGTRGRHQTQLQGQLPCIPCQRRRCHHPAAAPGWSPCLGTWDVAEVWEHLAALMADADPSGS